MLAPQFIPCLTSPAGTALTQTEWTDLGVTTAVYDLTTLLIKPGIELLSQLLSLAAYVNWPGFLILNATGFKVNAVGEYSIRSEFDGRTHRFTWDELLALILQLRPDAVILSAPQIPNTIPLWQGDGLISDAPADNALHGWIYSATGMSAVMDKMNALRFTSLDEGCLCPTCKAGFTWAYLHHLYQHTPGLCQRLLIQHNVHYVVQNLI
jgi:queuine/archaeosine tRNA-ribosyltransferase